jgi:hypothetical protein
MFQKWGGMQQTPIATSHKEVLQTWYSGKYRLSEKYGLVYSRLVGIDLCYKKFRSTDILSFG